jgi:gliding motility-associated protein GldC
MATKHTSEIVLKVHLDENKIPEKLEWQAEDGGVPISEAKAFLLSVWDPKANETLKMDLWTKDMPMDDMKFFFYQTLLSMADTFHKATNDEKMTLTMRDFAGYFAEKMEIIKKDE